ncbi:hypothetical protein [Streptomyces sp. NPDC054874]
MLKWWPLQEIDLAEETWQVGVNSMREVLRLSVFGETGQAAAEQTGALAFLRQQAQDCPPVNLAAFNTSHPGGKSTGRKSTSSSRPANSPPPTAPRRRHWTPSSSGSPPYEQPQGPSRPGGDRRADTA